jgi:eukaryotic-like serine/threonine-protein kinase
MQALATQSYEPPAAMPSAPKQIGRFDVRSEIGRGSNGVVYAAFDPVLGREVAIKAIPLAADNQVRRRAEANFLQEAKSAAGLNHPGIVTVFDAGKSESVAYIAMERLYGSDLHDWLAARTKLSPKAIASLMARVTDAVHYAHRRGLIHRDLKPSNVFLTRDMKPKVLDFGVALAQYNDTPLTVNRQLIGTPNYMSPEQALGRPLDARSDVFSMGAILYELLTGQRAFDGSQVEETLAKVASQQPTPIQDLNPDAPAELIEIVQRAMAKDASRRYQSAAEMRNDLVQVAAREDSGRRATLQPLPPEPAPPRHNKPIVVAALLAVLAVIAVLAFELLGRPSVMPGADPAATASSEIQVPVLAATDVTAAASRLPTSPESSMRSPTPTMAEIKPLHSVLRTAPTKAARIKGARPISTSQATPLEAMAPPVLGDGSVSLGITPWGEIVVDGDSHGVSPPLTHLTLPAGIHTIEVRNGAAPPFTSRIDLKPGESVDVKHRF